MDKDFKNAGTNTPQTGSRKLVFVSDVDGTLVPSKLGRHQINTPLLVFLNDAKNMGHIVIFSSKSPYAEMTVESIFLTANNPMIMQDQFEFQIKSYLKRQGVRVDVAFDDKIDEAQDYAPNAEHVRVDPNSFECTPSLDSLRQKYHIPKRGDSAPSPAGKEIFPPPQPQ